MQTPKDRWLDRDGRPFGARDGEHAEALLKHYGVTMREFFRTRFPTLSVGGFINPEVVSIDEQGHIEFRCHYEPPGLFSSPARFIR
jgi:hypothetical protein